MWLEGGMDTAGMLSSKIKFHLIYCENRLYTDQKCVFTIILINGNPFQLGICCKENNNLSDTKTFHVTVSVFCTGRPTCNLLKLMLVSKCSLGSY